jgi:aryl-alcohol dehydrogenase-like predicted oxidoreductase
LSSSISDKEKVFQTEESVGIGVGAIQVLYNRIDRSAENDILPLCQQLDFGVLIRAPLASGLLSGKYLPGAEFNSDDVRSTKDREEMEEKLRTVEKIYADEVPEGISMSNWALAWCLKHPAVTTVIPGCKTPEQVKDNIRTVEML